MQMNVGLCLWAALSCGGFWHCAGTHAPTDRESCILSGSSRLGSIYSALCKLSCADARLPASSFQLAWKLQGGKSTSNHVVTNHYSTCIGTSVQGPAESPLSTVIFLRICQAVHGKSSVMSCGGISQSQLPKGN